MCSLPHVFRKILNNFPDSKSDHRCEGDGQEMARSQGEDHKCEGWICGCDQHRVRRISVYFWVVKLRVQFIQMKLMLLIGFWCQCYSIYSKDTTRTSTQILKKIDMFGRLGSEC